MDGVAVIFSHGHAASGKVTVVSQLDTVRPARCHRSSGFGKMGVIFTRSSLQ